MGNSESNKKILIACVIAALVILAIAIIITLVTNLIGFCIILVTLFIILSICLSIYMKESPDDYAVYIKEKKRILKTYDSVIVEVETLPNIAGKNIIRVKTFDDLVDAQLELREPIYYKNDNDSCFFLLLHYNEACVFILKINEDVISPTEQSIRFMKPEGKEDKSDYENLLENIENTVIYKLDELRSFKISPVREAPKVEIVDDTAIKDVLENTTQISREKIEAELSKTQYLKDLKEKIAEAEAVEEEKANKKAAKEELKKEKEESTKKAEEKPKIDEKEESEPQETPVSEKKTTKKKSPAKSHASKRTKKYTKKD